MYVNNEMTGDISKIEEQDILQIMFESNNGHEKEGKKKEDLSNCSSVKRKSHFLYCYSNYETWRRVVGIQKIINPSMYHTILTCVISHKKATFPIIIPTV